MKKYLTIIVILLAILNVKCQVDKINDRFEKEEIHLIQDVNFLNGFIHQGNNSSNVKNDLFQPNPEEKPDWKLSQWYSKYVFTTDDLDVQSDGEYLIENNANKISIAKENEDIPVLTISSSGKLEWGNDTVRKPGDAWPHMLLSQGIKNCPTLDKAEKIQFSADVRVKNWQIHYPELYNPKIHAARFRLNFIIKNINKNAEGFNDYYWFVMTFFDNRHEFMPQTGVEDKGSDKKKATGKFIYGADAKLYLDKSLHELEWVSIDKDILPLIKDGVRQAQNSGFLLETDGIENYAIRGFNFGYELTGTINIESQVKNLDVVATIK